MTAANSSIWIVRNPVGWEAMQLIPKTEYSVPKLTSETPTTLPDSGTIHYAAMPSVAVYTTHLFTALQNIRESLDNWDEVDGDRPSATALSFAEAVVAHLPSRWNMPKLGIGTQGDVYFSWEDACGTAFLTIDDRFMHLLVKGVGQTPVYRDNVPYDKALLSNEVLPAIRSFASASRIQHSTTDR